uniref:Methionine--tRNA ligase, mitochondrial n=1 Tax=Dermatophagoides pteronyssinus TaxID=6956 RepID=A0A6P6YJR4_DERPT|nr:uncharacterized protein LOC113799075 [Dermatophagoides pteronyssinus]
MSDSNTIANRSKYYLTGALAYLNGKPHIGHAYEFLTSDVVFRFYEVLGVDAKYVLGSDEHGQKVEAASAAKGVKPQDWVDSCVVSFLELMSKLNITKFTWVRTTSAKHKECVHWLWNRVFDRGYVYLGTYDGWYNPKEEAFVTANEAKLHNFVCPVSKIAYEMRSEECYYFKMSLFHDRILRLIRDTDFLMPVDQRNALVARLESEPLSDLSVTRTKLSWGVPVPNDAKHVMYVWFDALSGYLSGVNAHKADTGDKTYWPADVHIIGKDIVWFHCVIWPAILMAAEIELPKHVFAHGFVMAEDGSKMSKSLNNVIEPLDYIEKCGADPYRWYTIRNGHYGHDIKFSGQALYTMNNADLCGIVGNLVNRGLSLCEKYCDSCVSSLSYSLLYNAAEILHSIKSSMEHFELEALAEAGLKVCRSANKFLTDEQPWIMEDASKRTQVIYSVLDSVYFVAHVLYPVIPAAALKICDLLNLPMQLLTDFNQTPNLKLGIVVKKRTNLFAHLQWS